jgi:hypothetical protein
MIKRSFAITRILSRTEETLSVERFGDHSRSNAIVGVLSHCAFLYPEASPIRVARCSASLRNLGPDHPRGTRVESRPGARVCRQHLREVPRGRRRRFRCAPSGPPGFLRFSWRISSPERLPRSGIVRGCGGDWCRNCRAGLGATGSRRESTGTD